MSYSLDSISQQVQALHKQLAALPSIDDELQQQLIMLQADINRLTDDGVEAPAEHSASAAVESLAVRFDADHPALSSALRNLVDSLGKAGI